MKKKAKKLVLAKETLRNLGAKDLAQIAGGVGPTDSCSGCDPIHTETCFHCPREPQSIQICIPF